MDDYTQLSLPNAVFLGIVRSEQVYRRVQPDLPPQQSRQDFVAELGRHARSGQRVEIPVCTAPNTTWIACVVGKSDTGRYLWDLYVCDLPSSEAA